MKYTTTVYGELLDIDGENLNVHLKLNNGDKIICRVNKKMAMELGKRLYMEVGLIGTVTEENSKIKEMKVTEISLYNPDKEKDPFALLRKAGAGKYFEKIDAIKYTQAIR